MKVISGMLRIILVHCFIPIILMRMSAATKKAWKCDNCRTEKRSSAVEKNFSEQQSEDTTTILNAIRIFKEEVSAKLENNSRDLKSVREEINSMKNSIRDFQQELTSVRDEQSDTNKRVDLLESENGNLKTSLSQLAADFHELEQYSRRCNMVIEGVPKTPNEDIYYVISELGRVLGVNYDRSHVSVVHRLPSRGGQSRPQAMIVRFAAYSNKIEWMSARRKFKNFSSKDLCETLPVQPIYLNDHLTTYSRDLFNRARKMKQEGELFAVWVRESKIFARRDPTGRVWRVCNVSDLQ